MAISLIKAIVHRWNASLGRAGISFSGDATVPNDDGSVWQMTNLSHVPLDPEGDPVVVVADDVAAGPYRGVVTVNYATGAIAFDPPFDPARAVDGVKVSGFYLVNPIPSYIGEKYINQNDSPPRLVWWPTSDSFLAPMRIGGDQRAVKDVMSGFNIALWGPDVASAPTDDDIDFERTRSMRDALVVAIHQECRQRFGGTAGQPQGYELQGGEWFTPGQITSFGFACMVRVSLREPVAPEAPEMATIETSTITTTFS